MVELGSALLDKPEFVCFLPECPAVSGHTDMNVEAAFISCTAFVRLDTTLKVQHTLAAAQSIALTPVAHT